MRKRRGRRRRRTLPIYRKADQLRRECEIRIRLNEYKLAILQAKSGKSNIELFYDSGLALSTIRRAMRGCPVDSKSIEPLARALGCEAGDIMMMSGNERGRLQMSGGERQ
ncbi:MAG: hypothetical protein LBB94_03895 [Clostridiales bacterium]|nr:hypothetical protein [Clostridiales bacterium]